MTMLNQSPSLTTNDNNFSGHERYDVVFLVVAECLVHSFGEDTARDALIRMSVSDVIVMCNEFRRNARSNHALEHIFNRNGMSLF